MKNYIRWLGVFVPAFVTFGPIIIVISIQNVLGEKMLPWAVTGAFMLAIGCVTLFRVAMGQKREIQELREQIQNIAGVDAP